MIIKTNEHLQKTKINHLKPTKSIEIVYSYYDVNSNGEDDIIAVIAKTLILLSSVNK